MSNNQLHRHADFRPRCNALALEPRVMFDAAAAVAVENHIAESIVDTPAPQATNIAPAVEITSSAPVTADASKILPQNEPVMTENKPAENSPNPVDMTTTAASPTIPTIGTISNTASDPAAPKVPATTLSEEPTENNQNPIGTTTALTTSPAIDATSIAGRDLIAPVAPEATLLVVDSNVANYQSLLVDLPDNVTVRVIESGESGLDAISRALNDTATTGPIQSIQIISHGSDGSVSLGSDTLDSTTLTQHSSQISGWAANLSTDADILLYGCDIAGGSEGKALLNQLATLTSADLAGSTDATGSAAKGGDWQLEHQTGRIESRLVINEATLAAYDSLLAAPVNTVPAAQTVAEDNTITFGVGKSIIIADADGTVQSVSISATQGTLTLSTTSGLTLTGNGTANISITAGTITNINAALNGLVYSPTANYSGADTLTLATYDGTTTDTDAIAITVSPNATAPILTMPTISKIVAEDTATYLDFTGANAIILTDVDANDQQTLTLSVAHGTLNIKTDVAGGISSASNNGTASVTLSGTAAQLSATLADTQGIQYTSVQNYNSSYLAAGVEALTFNLSDGVVAHNKSGSVSLNVTAVNDAPTFTGAVAATALEGGSTAFTRAQLAVSDNALDVDIETGQQVVNQLMVKIDSLPTDGTLSYNGGAVAIGTVVPVTNLGSLVFTHNGSDITSNQSISFNVTVSDGGGGSTAGTMSVTVQPKNVAPTISGTPTIIEGQVKVVAPTINLGDTFDTLANSTIVIDNLVTGSQGTFFIDANGNNIIDAGEALSGSTALDAAQRTGLATQLKFYQNGYEPNTVGATAPSYRISVTDAGGGTGVSSAAVDQTIALSVLPNNDDPTLKNLHGTVGTALTATEGAITAITSAMLQIADADLNPADTSQTTPENQLVYTIATRPVNGEIQVNIGGGLGYGEDGWITLGDGGRFTQAQVAAGQVRYYETVNIADAPTTTTDSFTFTVRDSAFGYDVWTDPANPTGGREGGLRNTPTTAIATQSFFFSITPLAAVDTPRDNTYEGAPRPATSGFGGSNMTYTFVPTGGMQSNNSIASGTWVEANVGAADGGYPITSAMLSYTITRTDTRGTSDIGDDISVMVPEAETVYTLTNQPPNGTVQRLVGGSWQTIATNGQFTQADITAGSIRFVHDGGEDHLSSFGYTVSDGTPNHYTAAFGLDITPTNDRPTGSGGSTQVMEKSPGNDGLVRLDGSALGMADIDLSLDGKGGEGAQDFLWFNIVAQPADGGSIVRGELQRWDGAAWVTITPGQWLPSTLLTTTADGATSGLRYLHDGSEPLAYTGGANVTFQYQVRDDLANPADPFATNASGVADSSGSAQSNLSANATTTIRIIPVNNAPEIADTPSDTDPTITGTITDGGTLTGNNTILANVPEGGTATITSAYLTGIDPDNTTVQRQYLLQSTPTQGVLLLNGNIIGVGSTFTQKNIDDGLVQYRHTGAEISAQTTDGLGTYNDKFHFTLSDAVFTDAGAGATNYNTFLITLASPVNDAPTLAGPGSAINVIGAATPITGFVLDDPDLAAISAGETDHVQVVVRILSSTDVPISDYATGFNGAGVTIGYATGGAAAGIATDGTHGGNNNFLVLQGTKTQVNAALAGLTLTFASDADTSYKVQVIVDDRMHAADGSLTAGPTANGGAENQALTVGGAATAIPSTTYNWLTDAAPTDVFNIVSATVDIKASNVNDPPILTAPTNALPVIEDIPLTLTGAGNIFSFSDADDFGASDLQAIVTATNGTLSLIAADGTAISGSGTATLTLTGTKTQINNALDGLIYSPAANYNGSANLQVTISDNGNLGGAAESDTESIALTVAPTNDAPTVARSTGTVTISPSGVATAVSGFAVTDVDYTDGGLPSVTTGEADFVQVIVRITNSSGTTPLTAGDYIGNIVISSTTAPAESGTAGSEFEIDNTLTGSGSALVIRGTLANVNTYLGGLTLAFGNTLNNTDTTYRVEVIADDRLRVLADGNLNGSNAANGGPNPDGADGGTVPDDVPVTVVDPYATIPAGLGYNVAANYRTVFVSGVNDPAPITATNITVNEGSATLNLTNAVGAFTVSDPDDNGANNLSATVTVSTGTITTVGGAGGTVGGTGTATITITGATKAQINSRLQALTITFPDEAGTPTSADWNGSFTVTVTVNDGGNTGNRPGSLTGDTDTPTANPGDYSYADGVSAQLVTTRTITVTVTGLNDAPIRNDATPVTLLTVNEDVAGGVGITPPGDTVTNLFGSKFNDALDGISGGSTINTFAGIAITTNAATAAQGTWQYSTDHNTWTTLPAVSTSSAVVLNASDYLRFVPAANFHGTPGSLTARLVDNSGAAIVSGATGDVSNDTTLSGGTTRYSDSNNAVTLGTTVTNINDRPTATATTLTATTEDNASPAGATISALGFGYNDNTDNQTAITGGGNAATAFGGIAIVGNAADASTQGIWQYNTGSGWVTIAGVNTGGTVATDSGALLLPTTASIRFLPNVLNYNGTPGSLTVRVADTATGFSAASDISATLADHTSTWSATTTLGTTVSPQNDAPTLTGTPSNPTLNENATTASGLSINPAILLNSGVNLTDIDLTTTSALSTTTFGAGTISVSFTDAYVTGDVLFVDTTTLAGAALPAGVTVSGGTANALTITLDSDTTLAEVKDLLEGISYQSTSDNPTINGTDNNRAYRIVVSDGNNDQGVPDAGGPTALSSANIDGLLTISPTNDPPTAVNDTNSIAENTASVSGNVKTGVGGVGNNIDTDPDNPNSELRIVGLRTGTEGAGGAMTGITAGTTSSNGTSILGTYGTIVLGADGSYIYTLDNSNPVVNALKNGQTLTEQFSYTLADPGPLTDVAQLTITINGNTDGALTIDPVDGNAGASGEATVYEKGIVTPTDNSHITTGTITVSAEDGISNVSIEGTSFTLAQLIAFTPGSPSGNIDTGEGLLKVTGFSETANVGGVTTVGVVHYTYTLKNSVSQVGATESTDVISLTVTDTSTTSAPGTLTVQIIDDSPTANADINAITEGNASVSGNVASLGSGGDVADRIGADTTAVPVTAVSFGGNPQTVGSVFNTSYGSFVINADGAYVYSLNNNNATVLALNSGQSLTEVIIYTITDSDGDSSSTTLTITINGVTQQASEIDMPKIPALAPPDDGVPPIVTPLVSQSNSSLPTFYPFPQPDTSLPPIFDQTSPLGGDQAGEPSVFFDGAVFDRIVRLPIPFHPVVFVNNVVEIFQQERSATDPIIFSDPPAVNYGEISSSSLGANLGFDPALFVQHAIRASQSEAAFLDKVVDGRTIRVNLSSDRLIPTPDLSLPILPMSIFSDQTADRTVATENEVVSEATPKTNTGQDKLFTPSNKLVSTHRPAPSFSEQLKSSGNRVTIALPINNRTFHNNPNT